MIGLLFSFDQSEVAAAALRDRAEQIQWRTTLMKILVVGQKKREKLQMDSVQVPRKSHAERTA
jgi:hypothetical protein